MSDSITIQYDSDPDQVADPVILDIVENPVAPLLNDIGWGHSQRIAVGNKRNADDTTDGVTAWCPVPMLTNDLPLRGSAQRFGGECS